MVDCNPTVVPMKPRLKLSKVSADPSTDATFYYSVVGSLCYIVTIMDIAFAIGYVSQYVKSPTTEHLDAVTHLLRYIAGSAGDTQLVGFSDLDLVGDVDDSQEHHRYYYIFSYRRKN